MRSMRSDEEEASRKLGELLKDAVEKSDAEALLLSGGLDTSILAALSPDGGKRKRALTVVLDGTRAPDLDYARKVAQKFRYEHHLIQLTETQAIEILPKVIEAVRSFDPALPNDVTIYAALEEAKKLEIKSVMTGDGADELFAGYSYMQGLSCEDLNTYIRAISKTMWFSSNKLGAFLDLEIKQPYRDQTIVEFALNLDPRLKVNERGGRNYGKWILRTAFEAELGELAWRAKEPIEFGSGTTKLRATIRQRISDTEFERKKREYGMEFMNKEHLFFYEIYKAVIGEIPKPEAKEKGEAVKLCPLCKAELPGNRFHCNICGFSYPLDRFIGAHHETTTVGEEEKV